VRTRLVQFEQRVAELEKMAEEVLALAVRFSKHEEVQPQLSIKTQTWFHAARGFMEKVYPEKVEWLEHLCRSGARDERIYRYGQPMATHRLEPELRLFSPIFRDRTRAGIRQRRKGKLAGI